MCVALFCKDLGVQGTHAISFGDSVGYSSISWAHYGTLESLGVALAPRKIQFHCKKTIQSRNLSVLEQACRLGATMKVGLGGLKKWPAQFFWSMVVTRSVWGKELSRFY